MFSRAPGAHSAAYLRQPVVLSERDIQSPRLAFTRLPTNVMVRTHYKGGANATCGNRDAARLVRG